MIKGIRFLKDRQLEIPKGQDPFLEEENGNSTSYRGWGLHQDGETPRFVEIPRLNAPATLPYERPPLKVNAASGGFGLREGRAYAGSSEFRSSRPGNRDDLNTIGRSPYAHVNKRDRSF